MHSHSAATLLARQRAYLLVFYGLGTWTGAGRLPRVPAAAIVATALSSLAWASGLHYFHILTAPIAFRWLTVVLDLSHRATGRTQAALAWLGQRSRAIYVSHFFFITAVRIALDRGLGITSFAWNLPLRYAAALGGSIALLALTQRLGIAGLLGLGGQPVTWPSPAGRAPA